MNTLSKQQILSIDKWMHTHARPYDLAKWNYLVNDGSKDNVFSKC